MSALRYALGSILRRKGRLVASIIVIALVVGLLGGFIISFHSFSKYIYEEVRESFGGVDIRIDNSTGYIDVGIIDKIKSVEGVAAVDYELSLLGVLKTDDKEGSVPLLGVTGGFYWSAKLGERISGNEAIVTKAVAEDYGITKGDEVNYTVFLKGEPHELKLEVVNVKEVKTFTAFAPPILEVYVNISFLWEKIPELKGKVSTIYVKAESADVVDKVYKELKDMFKDLSVDKVTTRMELGFEKSTLFLMIYVIASAIIFLALVFYLNVEERKKEIGILKTLGASNAQIVGILMTEALIYSALGTLLGFGASLAIGRVFAEAFEQMMKLTEGIPLVVPATAFIYGAALGFGIPMLTMLVIGLKAIKVRPASVLREVIEEIEGKLGRRMIIMGAIFFALGIGALYNEYLDLSFWWGRLAGLCILLPVIVLYALGDKLANALESISGAVGKLSVVFLRRKISRAILIVSLLGMALSFTALTVVSNRVWMGLAEKTVEEKMLFDISLSFAVPMNWSVRDRILKVNGVEDIMLIGFYPTASGNHTVFLMIVNVTKFPEFLGWKPKYGTINIKENETFLFELGIRFYYNWTAPNPKNTNPQEVLGKNLTVVTDVGNVTLKIAGILESTLSEMWIYPAPVPLGLGMFVDLSFLKYLPYSKSFLVMGALVKVKEGANVTAVAEAIKEEIGKNTVSTMTKQEWLETSTQISKSIGMFFYAIGFVLYLIAVALIFVTQFKMIMQWGREIATIMSLGESRGGIVLMFLLQMLLLGLIASLVVAIDYYLVVPSFIHSMGAGLGIEFEVVYAWPEFLILCCITTLIAMLASIPAACKAANQNIAQVLRIL